MVDSAESLPARGAGSERDWPVPWEPVWGEADGLGSRIGTLAARSALALVVRVPEGVLAPLLGALASLGTRFGRARSRAAREFLHQALGELPARERERLVRRGWLQLLRVTVDTERLARIPRTRLREHFALVLSKDAERVLAEKRGFVIASAHLGNWEVAFAALPAFGLHPVYGVAKPPKNRSFSRLVQASRERWGVRVVSRKGAMGAAPAILRAGGTLAMVIDQRTSGRALLVPFFGRPARCERAPAVLLKRQRVPIVLGTCLMLDQAQRYRIELGEVLWPEEWARRGVEEIVLRVNQGFERQIRAHPEQYVWIHDRYRDTPRELAPDAPARLQRGAAATTPAPRGASDAVPSEDDEDEPE